MRSRRCPSSLAERQPVLGAEAPLHAGNPEATKDTDGPKLEPCMRCHGIVTLTKLGNLQDVKNRNVEGGHRYERVRKSCAARFGKTLRHRTARSRGVGTGDRSCPRRLRSEVVVEIRATRDRPATAHH